MTSLVKLHFEVDAALYETTYHGKRFHTGPDQCPHVISGSGKSEKYNLSKLEKLKTFKKKSGMYVLHFRDNWQKPSKSMIINGYPRKPLNLISLVSFDNHGFRRFLPVISEMEDMGSLTELV